jgi:hypothetical protein
MLLHISQMVYLILLYVMDIADIAIQCPEPEELQSKLVEGIDIWWSK